MKVREVAAGLLWGASAVEVVKFTYVAATATFSSFPDTGTSQSVQQSVNKNETSLGIPKNATGLIDAIEHPLTFPKGAGRGTFGINGPITKWLENLVGTRTKVRRHKGK